MDGQQNGWTQGWIDRGKAAGMDTGIDEWKNAGTDGWKDAGMDVGMDG